MDLSAFTESVGNFQFDWEVSWKGEPRNFFEAPMDAVIAYTVPWVEIFAAVALLLPFTKLGGAVILMVMMGAFNIALGYAWSLGITDLNCGCHGVSETPTNFPVKIASNFGLMYVAGLILWLSWYHRRLASEVEEPKVES